MTTDIETRLREIEERKCEARNNQSTFLLWKIALEDLPFLVGEVRRLVAENEQLKHLDANDRKWLSEQLDERDKLRDWRNRAVTELTAARDACYYCTHGPEAYCNDHRRVWRLLTEAEARD